jgi:hypothetical protein
MRIPTMVFLTAFIAEKYTHQFGEAPKANHYQWDAIFADGDMYKAGLQGQGLYVSSSRDVIVVYFSTVPRYYFPGYARAIALSYPTVNQGVSWYFVVHSSDLVVWAQALMPIRHASARPPRRAPRVCGLGPHPLSVTVPAGKMTAMLWRHANSVLNPRLKANGT